MFNLFKTLKTNALLVINIVITLTTLLYLVSIHGFSHLNKEVINGTLIAIAFGILIITIAISAISFILYIAFKTTYKNLNRTLENITKNIDKALDDKINN